MLLSTHINPDGDGLGSEIAFYHYLKDKNINCRIINASKPPESLSFLSSDNIIELYNDDMDDWIKSCDLAISFDIGDYNRMMEIGIILNGNVPVICFDHHPQEDESKYSHILLDINAPATGYMAWKYFQINYPNRLLSKDIAVPLYVALVTDTGSFKYECTSADTHRMAANLIECGVDNFEIQRHLYEQKPISRVKVLGKAIEIIRFACENKIAWVEITQNLLNECSATMEDIEGIGEFLRSIRGVEASIVLVEREDSKVKITFRSKGRVTVNDVAKVFSGGGHKFAAGAVTDFEDMNLIMNKINKILTKKMENIYVD